MERFNSPQVHIARKIDYDLYLNLKSIDYCNK